MNINILVDLIGTLKKPNTELVHYAVTPELSKIPEVLALEYDFARIRTRTRESPYLPSSE
jgi:hypothetical protein